MGRKKKKNNGCTNQWISKEDKKKLYSMMSKVDWCDEDSVWDFAVEVGRLSVLLRSDILSHSDDE